MPEGFPPLAEKNARVLILGTMPSVQSLEKLQYYGNPQNAFWRILFSLWGRPLPERYADRTAFLQEKRIALWDVLRECERKGSADASIARPEPNDFSGLIKRCPGLEAVFFNSQGAARFYGKLVCPDPLAGLPKHILPSTSPARAMRFEEKRTLWLPVREALEPDENSPRVRSHFPSETGAGHDNPADTDKTSGNF